MKIDLDYLEKIGQLSNSKKSVNKVFFKYLRQYYPGELDDLVHQAHKKVFSEVDCLQSTICYKSISPQLFRADIEHMAGALKMKTSDFMDQYIKTDEDNDLVFT